MTAPKDETKLNADEALLPCPFCGSLMVADEDDVERAAFVWCVECGASGPETTDIDGYDYAEAHKRWNQRADSALKSEIATLTEQLSSRKILSDVVTRLGERLQEEVGRADKAEAQVVKLEITQDMLADAVGDNREVTAVAVCAALAKALGIKLPKKLIAVYEEAMQRITTVVNEFDARSNQLLDTKQTIATLTATNKRLSEALEKYGRHTPPCAVGTKCVGPAPCRCQITCTCGLTAALSEVTRLSGEDQT